DIAGGAEQLGLAVYLKGNDAHLHGKLATVAVPEHAFVGGDPLVSQAGRDQRTELVPRMHDIPGGKGGAGMPPGRVAEHAVEGITGVQQPAPAVENVDAVTGMLQQQMAAPVGPVA